MPFTYWDYEYHVILIKSPDQSLFSPISIGESAFIFIAQIILLTVASEWTTFL